VYVIAAFRITLAAFGITFSVRADADHAYRDKRSVVPIRPRYESLVLATKQVGRSHEIQFTD
jgi:hypothetical protein